MKRVATVSLFLLFFVLEFFAQSLKISNNATVVDDQIHIAVLGTSDVLVQGLDAYKNEDWNTALFFLRKAVSEPENSTPDTWYVMIMAEIFATDYKNALRDGTIFLERFSDSKFIPQITYQNARAYFDLGDYNQAIIHLSDFCETYPKHELMTYAMFWTAESLYQLYRFSEAKNIFQKIVQEYPLSPKYIEAEYRLELLNQREREEKLLYLLRVTSEEYLSAREDYERQLAVYESKDSLDIREQLKELQKKVTDLTLQNSQLQAKNDELDTMNATLKKATSEAAQALRMAAAEKQAYLAGANSASAISTSAKNSEILTTDLNDTSAYSENEALLKLLQKAAELEKLITPVTKTSVPSTAPQTTEPSAESKTEGDN
jgi:TolA-binding protein